MTRLDLVRFWWAYCNPLITCPPTGDLLDGDSIWVLAFGRNTFTDAELGKKLLDLGAGEDSDLEVFGRLKAKKFAPGGTNYNLAGRALSLALDTKFPLTAQWEVNYAMWQRFPSEYTKQMERIKAVWAPPNLPYWPTPEVIRDMKAHAQRIGTNRPILYAQKNHLARVVAVAWRQGINVLVTGENILTMDPASVQPATRRLIGLNPATCWLPRETVARLAHHPLKGLVRLTPPA